MSVFVPGGDDGGGIVGVQSLVDLGGSVLGAIESGKVESCFQTSIVNIIKITRISRTI